jgi:hypothetical protein
MERDQGKSMPPGLVSPALGFLWLVFCHVCSLAIRNPWESLTRGIKEDHSNPAEDMEV